MTDDAPFEEDEAERGGCLAARPRSALPLSSGGSPEAVGDEWWLASDLPGEPTMPRESEGEWPGPRVVEEVAGWARPAPGELWLIDPTEDRLVYGRWVLGPDGLAGLRELNRVGVSVSDRPSMVEALPHRPARRASEIARVVGILVGASALWAWVTAVDTWGQMPGWPWLPCLLTLLAGLAFGMFWWFDRRASQVVADPRNAQVNALLKVLDVARVRAPSAAVIEVAALVRAAWQEFTATAGYTQATPAEQHAWQLRVDRLLYALALSQPSGSRPGRPELRGWIHRNTQRMLFDLAQGSGKPTPEPAPDPVAPEEQTLTHYPRYPG